MRIVDFLSQWTRLPSLRRQPSDWFDAAGRVLATILGIALTACAARAGDLATHVQVASASLADADPLSLSPPSFPLDSPLAQRRFLRSALYECAYRESELYVRPAGNPCFDYPSQSPASAGAAYDMRQSLTTAPASSATAACNAVQPSLIEQASGVNFYARVDYFYWRESVDNYRLLEESGPLVTLGVLTQHEERRLRAEIFGGQVNYDGETMDGVPLKINTDYIGCRFQYDLLFPFQYDPNSAFVLGLGTRLWNRNLRDGTDDLGGAVTGYDETWWMLYPMFGLETRRPMGPSSHWFASASLGVTGFTYERIDAFDVTLYPKMGPMVQMECGIQTPRVFLSVFLEVMQWYASNASAPGPEALYQPDSMRLTAGFTGGIHF